MGVTPSSAPVAEPIASVLQPLLPNDTGKAGEAKAAALFERLRELAMQWHDPFYSGNNQDETVLASFEIDHDSVTTDLISEYRYTTCVRICISALLALSLLVMLGLFWKDYTVVASVMFLILLCVGYFLLLAPFDCTKICYPTKDMLLAGRHHVAIGRDGVYLDDADQRNRNLVRRQVLPFTAISTIRAAEVGCLRPSYRVVITTVPVPIINAIESRNRGGGNDKLQAEYVIRGLCKAQAFVDVIHMAIALNANSHPTVIV